MKKYFFLFLIFLGLSRLAFAAGIQADIDGEKIEIGSDGRKWSLGFEDHAGDRGIYEYVLPGEKVENWSEMVTINYFKNLQGPDLLERFIGFTKGGLSVTCKKVTWKDLGKTVESISYEWFVTGCQKAPDQSELARAMVGKKGLYVLHYASKKVPMPNENHAAWFSLLNKAKITAPSDQKAA